jgi:septum formation protein
MAPPRLILASGSPRRKDLLAEAGYAFTVEPADVDEERLAEGVAPHRLPRHLADIKAEAVAKLHASEPVVILAADTIALAADETVLGKPRDRADAARMLRVLSGTVHRVVTGWSMVRCDDGRRLGGHVRSDVIFRPLSDGDIAGYLDTGAWHGKAGGYGLQDEPGCEPGGGAPFVESISGELTNIIGLPMPQVVEALGELGVCLTA